MPASNQPPRPIPARYWADFARDVARLLRRPPDLEKALAALARAAARRVADICIADLREGERLHRVEMAGSDPMRQLGLDEGRKRYPPRKSNPIWRVLKTGEPELVPAVTRRYLEQIAVDPIHMKILLERGPRSYITVPLKTSRSSFAALTFCLVESNRRYGPGDLALAVAIAERISMVLGRLREPTKRPLSGFRYRSQGTAEGRPTTRSRSK